MYLTEEFITCNQFFAIFLYRKELQKDVDKLKKKIKVAIAKADDQSLEEARKMYNEWMNLLDELLVEPRHRILDWHNWCSSYYTINKMEIKEWSISKNVENSKYVM